MKILIQDSNEAVKTIALASSANKLLRVEWEEGA
jgi:hypothetical protein